MIKGVIKDDYEYDEEDDNIMNMKIERAFKGFEGCKIINIGGYISDNIFSFY